MLFWGLLACLVVYAPYYIPLLLIWKLLKWFIKWLFKPREWLPYEEPELHCTVEIDEKAEKKKRDRERKQAIAQTTIDYYEPERRRLLDEIRTAEKLNQENKLQKLRKQLYNVEVKLQKAYFDKEE